MRRLQEAKYQISSVNRKEVKVSQISPEIIYNSNIERIRAKEYQVGSAPQAIRFQMFGSLANKPDLKLIKL